MLAAHCCPALSPSIPPPSSVAEKVLALQPPSTRSSRGGGNRTRWASTSSLRHSSPAMEVQGSAGGDEPPMKLLFVEMGVGYDQHGQDITAAAMRACRDAISSNSIPAFRRGSIPGVNSDHMKLQIKLGVPRQTQQYLDIERVKSVFPYDLLDVFDLSRHLPGLNVVIGRRPGPFQQLHARYSWENCQC